MVVVVVVVVVIDGGAGIEFRSTKLTQQQRVRRGAAQIWICFCARLTIDMLMTDMSMSSLRSQSNDYDDNHTSRSGYCLLLRRRRRNSRTVSCIKFLRMH